MQLPGLDSGFALRPLLAETEAGRIGRALVALLGAGARIVDDAGSLVYGCPEANPANKRAPLMVLTGIVGFLECDTSDELVAAAAILLESTLECAARYLLATELHAQAVHEDYERLLQEHRALEESEGRYRALSESLEQRVAEQVKTIEDTQIRLYQSEKLASVGRLGAGIAHEINNPIGFIRSNLTSAQAYVEQLSKLCLSSIERGDDATAESANSAIETILEDFECLLAESVEGADRIAQIVAWLREFSNADRAEEQYTDINQIVRATCEVIASNLSPSTRISLALGELPKTRCRPRQLGQVFMNVVLNGSQALNGRDGELLVRTRVIANAIEAQVSDTGCGIDESNLASIFDPFFTTREVGQGMGLGLAVSRNIVEAHGGTIEVKSQVHEGTTVTMRLPIRK